MNWSFNLPASKLSCFVGMNKYVSRFESVMEVWKKINQKGLQEALQEALRELQGVPRPPPLCCCHTPGDDAPTPNTLCPGPDRGARVCDSQVSATLSPGMGAIIPKAPDGQATV